MRSRRLHVAAKMDTVFQLSAAAQQKRFVLCLLLFTTALAFLASQSVFVVTIKT
jgi:hypothetical protein